MRLSPALTPGRFEDLPGWRGDDSREALQAFRRSAAQAAIKPYRTGRFGLSCAAFEASFEASLTEPAEADPKAFFERWFVPCRVDPAPARTGLVTGFYEPILPASPHRSDRFRFPLLRRPDDLLDIDDRDRPPSMDRSVRYGRLGPGGLEVYPDRAAIEAGALDGRGLEIVWLDDRFETFLVHVQGAARLVFADGTTRRVTYAAKSGHPFTGPGHVLVAMGELAAESVTLPMIRQWFAANPHRMDDILQLNRSFIFFREAPVDDPELGPIAAAKVALTTGRSIAVDRELHTFGTPIFVDAPSLTAFGAPFRRLMIAQDTGSAIVGPARGDLFAGSGAAAEAIAGIVRHEAAFHLLVPRPLVA